MNMKSRNLRELRIQLAGYLSEASELAGRWGNEVVSEGWRWQASNLRIEAEQTSTEQPQPPKRAG